MTEGLTLVPSAQLPPPCASDGGDRSQLPPPSRARAGQCSSTGHVCSRGAVGALQLPYNCHVKSLHPIPAPELWEDIPCPTAPAWPGDPAVGTAAGVPSCRRAGCGQAPAPAPSSRRAAAPANSEQPGAAARALCFPLRPFISTACERLSAMLRRGKGGMVLCLLRLHRAALREPGTDVPVPSGKVRAWGKAAFPHP